MFRKDVISRMGAVEREYRAASLALATLLKNATDDPTILYPTGVEMADIRLCRDNFEITYITRIFAVFEESLREVRRIVYGRNTPIQTYDLLQQAAARRNVPNEYLVNAHAVRAYRNSVIHGGEAQAITLPQARTWLCLFFAWMPPEW